MFEIYYKSGLLTIIYDMLTKRAQIVIGIGILVLSAAFLLVGIYFANAQGLIFQNGAQSLQLFSNNMASAINSIYGAPSNMQISLAGNSSLCSWNPASDSYDCAGGSKIYNLSYATGPTIDSGQSSFSVALCFMVGVLPTKGAIGKLRSLFGAGTSTAESTTLAAVEGAGKVTAIGSQNIPGDTFLAIEGPSALLHSSEALAEADKLDAGVQIIAKFREGQGVVGAYAQDLATGGIKALTPEEVRSALEYADKLSLLESAPTTIEEVAVEGDQVGASLSINAIAKRFVAPLLIASIATDTALQVYPIIAFWFGNSNTGINIFVNKGISVNGQPIGALTGPSNSISNQILAAYLSKEPLPFKYGAMNLALQKYSKTLSSIGFIENLPLGSARASVLFDAYQQSAVTQAGLAEISAYISNQGAGNPYTTPTGGVASPSTLTAPGAFVGNVNIAGKGDPVLSSIAFMAQDAFLTYGQTASCLGSLSQLDSVSSWKGLGAASNVATIAGAALSLANVYTKTNNIMYLGSYFVGYGGETYVTGESSGRPSVASSPIISDLADLCSIAETSSEPGKNINTLIMPSGNGSISFSINQGLYNTMCSNQNALFPKTLSDFVNKIISLKPSNNQGSVSILLPPQYVLAIYNSSTSSNICIYRDFIQSFGSPIMFTQTMDGMKNSALEFGMPVSCINMTNMSEGSYNLIFNATKQSGGTSFDLTNQINSNAFFLNSKNIIGFSVPLGDYPNAYNSNGQLAAGSFIKGNGQQAKTANGVDSPVVSLIASVLKQNTPRLQATGFSILDGLVSTLSSLSEFIAPSNLSYYQTDYANVTLNIATKQINGKNYYNIISANSNLVFGVYPNNYNSFGGTYVGG